LAYLETCKVEHLEIMTKLAALEAQDALSRVQKLNPELLHLNISVVDDIPASSVLKSISAFRQLRCCYILDWTGPGLDHRSEIEKTYITLLKTDLPPTLEVLHIDFPWIPLRSRMELPQPFVAKLLRRCPNFQEIRVVDGDVCAWWTKHYRQPMQDWEVIRGDNDGSIYPLTWTLPYRLSLSTRH